MPSRNSFKRVSHTEANRMLRRHPETEDERIVRLFVADCRREPEWAVRAAQEQKLREYARRKEEKKP